MCNIFQTLYDALMTNEVTWLSASIKLIISFILGILIGLERQSRRQSAGLRTFALICMGSAAAMLMSIWIPQTYNTFLNGDPGRIAAQIITGIGFLGAGAIIQSKGGVYGLTTAASIWVVAIIGMCVGAGMYVAALLSTALVLLALIILNRLENKRNLSGEAKELVVEYHGLSPDLELLKKLLAEESVYLFNITISKYVDSNRSSVHIRIHVDPLNPLNNLFEQLQRQSDVLQISLRML